MTTGVYVENDVGMAQDHASAAWSFDLDHWGRCGQGGDERSVLLDLHATTGSTCRAWRVVCSACAGGSQGAPVHRWLSGQVIGSDVFRDQPVLTGRRVRLEPLTPVVLEDYLVALADPELSRLTGSHAGMLDRPRIGAWLATRGEHHDRADWAAVRIHDGAFLGEAVLNELDPDNESANYRVWLAGPQVFGQGYGTEVTRLVVDYALDTVGLHRVSLSVYDFNPRAQRVYEKSGFRHEGRLREALRWDGDWHDELLMSILRTDPRPGG